MEGIIGTVQRVDDIEVDLSIDRVFETPPFPTWTSSKYSRDRLEEPVRRLAREVQQAIDPRAMYGIFSTEETTIRDYDPPAPVLEASHVCTLVVTVGNCQASRPGSEPVFDEMVRDALENAALTITKERVATDIREQANEAGWNTTRLFSPGSGNVDWAVENSAFVFETLPASEIGVSISENGLIRPNKSVSSVIGLGPEIEQAPALFTCEGCPRIPDCPYARSAGLGAAES